MDFLVEIDVRFPPDVTADEVAAIAARELACGRELVANGTIRSIWRIPGRRASVGIWSTGRPQTRSMPRSPRSRSSGGSMPA
jgi:muconolactone D-isomerase